MERQHTYLEAMTTYHHLLRAEMHSLDNHILKSSSPESQTMTIFGDGVL